MPLNDQQLHTLSQLAIRAARAAGEIISAHRDQAVQVQHKDAGTSTAAQVVTEVDHKAQAAILELLQPSCAEYDLALLTEESPDDGQRHQKPAFWCIDPMDGTLAFINNTPGFSVSIALVARDGKPLIGVAYDPTTQSLYRAIRGQGAFKNDQAMQLATLDPCKPLALRADLSFQPHPWRAQTLSGLQHIATQLGLNGAEIQYFTGGVMNALGVLETPNICYFKYPKSGNSGGSLWDYAASACIYHEVGAVATDIYGQTMQLNRAGSTYMNHRGLLFAAHPGLAEPIIALHRTLSESQH